MSLTSQLDDAGSPITVFLTTVLPDVMNVSAAFHAVRPPDREALCPPAPERGRLSWRTLNTAIDHRLRYAFAYRGMAPRPVERGIAAAWRLAPPESADAVKHAGDDVTAALAKLISDERPKAGQPGSMLLDPPAEDALDRICYVMACFENVYRTRHLPPDSLLVNVTPDLTADRLLRAVPGYAVDDIRAVVALADTSLARLRDSCPPDRVHTGPPLAGSLDVGGADADLIADDLLVEFSSTRTPSQLGARDFYQVLGYAILDYGDRYGIRRLGFYLSRFGRLVTWTLEDMLALLGSRLPLGDLREQCARWLALAP